MGVGQPGGAGEGLDDAGDAVLPLGGVAAIESRGNGGSGKLGAVHQITLISQHRLPIIVVLKFTQQLLPPACNLSAIRILSTLQPHVNYDVGRITDWIMEAPTHMANAVLHTIGYEGSSIDEFLGTLLLTGVDLLIDVRDVPISRKRGFSKTALADRLAGNGMEYIHLKGLGDPKPGRIAAREGRYDDFRQIFGAHLKGQIAQTDLMRGIQAARGRKACLLCFERDHSNCHRCIVAEEMASKGGFRLVHLGVSKSASTNTNLKNPPYNHDPFAIVG